MNMKESTYYSSKPPACSSPIVQMIDGVLHRVHDGYKLGSTVCIEPSKYPVHDSLRHPVAFDVEEE
jgi:hypothetical protein